MVKEYHGKTYYMEFDNDKLAEKCIKMIFDNPYFEEDLVGLRVNKDTGKCVVYFPPGAGYRCGDFRGEKYSAWEKIKRDMYKLKKEES